LHYRIGLLYYHAVKTRTLFARFFLLFTLPILTLCLPWMTFHACAKEAQDFLTEYNPDVDLSELDLHQITLYSIESHTGSRADANYANDEIIRYLQNHGVRVMSRRDLKPAPAADPYALNLSGAKKPAPQLCAAAPTDLVLPAKLTRLSFVDKTAVPQTMLTGKRIKKKFWTISMNLFVYSVSRDAIVYRADLVRIVELSGYRKNRKEFAIRRCIEEALNPFFDYKSSKAASDTIKIPDSATPTKK
jgi:hypothetical protein